MITFIDIINKLKNKEPFTFTRWGDGEWSCCFGVNLDTLLQADGHEYFPEIGVIYKQILESKPKYIMGLQSLGYLQNKDKIDKLGIERESSDMFHYQSAEGNLQPLVDVLRGLNTIIVGPEYLRKLNIGYKDFIEIPTKNCYLTRDATENELVKLLINREPSVVLFSAGFLSNILIDSLYNIFGNTHTFINIGSLRDPYVGKITRDYHKNIINPHVLD